MSNGTAHIDRVSLVIPTHNRHASLARTLDGIGRQTFPPEKLEVVVVADNCSDGTIEMLKTYKSAFSLQVVVAQGRGAAVARNAGAALASGSIIVFIDDDIEATETLIEAHVREHERLENGVVIGYVPPILAFQKGFFKVRLWETWENMFYVMSQKDHRFSYRDLLSGNFSVSSALFKKIDGFNSSFLCQEDYEIGVRLIEAGANFRFAPQAAGFHHELTDLNRTLQRKAAEGKAAVQFCQTYPELLYSLPLLPNFVRGYSTYFRVMLFFIYHVPLLSDFFARFVRHGLTILEGLRMRHAWDGLLRRLHAYWFMRGVGEATRNVADLSRLLRQKAPPVDQLLMPAAVIDVSDGLEAAEKLIDELRPTKIDLWYRRFPIGSIVVKSGFERLKGVHLRAALAKDFSYPLLEAIAFSNETNVIVFPEVPDVTIASKIKHYAR